MGSCGGGWFFAIDFDDFDLDFSHVSVRLHGDLRGARVDVMSFGRWPRQRFQGESFALDRGWIWGMVSRALKRWSKGG